MKPMFDRMTVAVLTLVVLLLPACASGGANSRPAPAPAPAPTAAPDWNDAQRPDFGPLGSDPSVAEGTATTIEESLEQAGYDPGRTYNLNVRNTDVRAVLLAIARDSGISISIEPDVEGAVTTDIHGVTLPVLFESLLEPLDLEYRVESGVVKVRERHMETRFFFLDIVQTDRNGSRSVGVSTGNNGGGGGGQGGGGQGGGALGGGGQGGGGQGGGGTASVQSDDPSFIWDDITEGVGFLMSSGFGGFGGRDLDDQRRLGNTGGFGFGGNGGDRGNTPSLHVNRSAGTVMVRHYPDVLDEIAEYLASVEEIAQRQVLIEAQIVEVVMRDEYAAGIDWQGVFTDLGLTVGQTVGGSGLSIFQAGVARKNFNAVLGAMSNQGNVNVLSTPSVVTLNNQVALLSVGTQEVFFTTTTVFNGQGNLAQTLTQPGTVTNGVTLSVTPQVSSDGWVTMSIQPAVSNLAGEAIGPNGDRFPIMDVRVTDNVIRVREGETIFIGGLLEDVISESESKTPILGDIPLLGSLFKRKDIDNRKADLIIMITPTVLHGERVREVMRDQLQRIEMRRRSAKSGVRRGM